MRLGVEAARLGCQTLGIKRRLLLRFFEIGVEVAHRADQPLGAAREARVQPVAVFQSASQIVALQRLGLVTLGEAQIFRLGLLRPALLGAELVEAFREQLLKYWDAESIIDVDLSLDDPRFARLASERLFGLMQKKWKM